MPMEDSLLLPPRINVSIAYDIDTLRCCVREVGIDSQLEGRTLAFLFAINNPLVGHLIPCGSTYLSLGVLHAKGLWYRGKGFVHVVQG